MPASYFSLSTTAIFSSTVFPDGLSAFFLRMSGFFVAACQAEDQAND